MSSVLCSADQIALLFSDLLHISVAETKTLHWVLLLVWQPSPPRRKERCYRSNASYHANRFLLLRLLRRFILVLVFDDLALCLHVFLVDNT